MNLTELLNDPSVIIAIIALIGTAITAAWNVRGAVVGATDEIAEGAATMLKEYREERTQILLDLAQAKTEIADLQIQIKQLKEAQQNEIEKMKKSHAKEIASLEGKIKTITNDYRILKRKHNELVKAYEKEKKDNNCKEEQIDELNARIEKLEKGDTGPLKAQKE